MSTAFAHWHWQPPARFQRITTVEMHTGGEPLRIFTAGLPELPGESVLEKRRYFRDHRLRASSRSNARYPAWGGTENACAGSARPAGLESKAAASGSIPGTCI